MYLGMARKPRIHAPGSVRHLISRGNRHQDIFEAAEEFLEFTASFSEAAKKGGMQPLTLTLMPNHWHALVREGAIPIGEVLQPVLTKFAMRSNRRNGRDGHLFQGRYKAYLIDSDAKVKEVFRYIHKNPLRAKLVEDISQWPWSSHHEYAGLEPESTVSTDFLLSLFAEDKPTAQKRYLEFMKQDPPKGVRPDMVPALDALARHVEQYEGFPPGTLSGEGGDLEVRRARHRFIRLAVKAGVRPVDIAAYLHVSPSTVFYAQRG